MRIFNKLAAIAFAACTMAAPVLAADDTPAGQWQSVTGDARYTVSMCGDGTKLCVKLVWLSAELRTTENLQYLNTWVIRNARPADDNEWRGEVEYEGATVNGHIRLVSGDRLEVNGCRLILCQKLEFIRI